MCNLPKSVNDRLTVKVLERDVGPTSLSVPCLQTGRAGRGVVAGG